MATSPYLVTLVFQLGLIVVLAVPVHIPADLANHFIPVSGVSKYCPCRCCLLPHPEDCKSYYLCLDNALYQSECEDGELFNKVLENCDYEDRVHCLKPTPCEFLCKKKEGLFRHPKDCGSFIQCSNWMPYVHTCPATLHFSEELERCEYPSIAKCIHEGLKYIRDKTIHGKSGHTCPERNGMFQYSGNSSLYLQCEDWSPRIRFCPPDTQYNAQRWICTTKKIN